MRVTACHFALRVGEWALAMFSLRAWKMSKYTVLRESWGRDAGGETALEHRDRSCPVHAAVWRKAWSCVRVLCPSVRYLRWDFSLCPCSHTHSRLQAEESREPSLLRTPISLWQTAQAYPEIPPLRQQSEKQRLNCSWLKSWLLLASVFSQAYRRLEHAAPPYIKGHGFKSVYC